MGSHFDKYNFLLMEMMNPSVKLSGWCLQMLAECVEIRVG
jgi:hypothetical protein